MWLLCRIKCRNVFIEELKQVRGGDSVGGRLPVPVQHKEIPAVCCAMQSLHYNLDLPKCDQAVAAAHISQHDQ